MFERFTSSARGAVIQARDEAVRACHERVGTEHLVIALADDTGIAGEVLRDAGVTANALRRALAETSTTPDVDLDADALRSLGIDLDDVRRSVEETFGVGALDVPAGAVGPPRGRQRAGHVPFSPDAKKTLERAVRQALTLGQNRLGSEHVLLGVLDVDDGLGARLLAALGVDLGQLRATVIERSRRSA
jgi:ATP-dependent Clp protease ATP-binding subunit ClpA